MASVKNAETPETINIIFTSLRKIKMLETLHDLNMAFFPLVVMSASFCHEDKSQFVIGSEAGGVFKCSMNSGAPPAASKLKQHEQ